MLTTHDILWGIIFPAMLAIVAMLVSHVPPWKRDAKTLPFGPAMAVGGGFAVAFAGIAGWPKLPPIGFEGWLVYLAMAAAVIGVVATFPKTRSIVVQILSALLVIATAYFLLAWRAPQWGLFAVVAVAGVVWWFATDRLAARAQGPGLPILLGLFGACAALVLTNSGTQSFGQIAAGAGVAVGVVGLTGLWFRRLSLAHGGVLALTITLMAMLLCGHLLAEVTWRDVIILAIAPLTLWIGQLPPLRRRAWLGFITTGIAMAIVVSIAAAPAIKGLMQTMKEQTESYQY